MATNTQTIHGKKVRFGIAELANCLITSAELTPAKEVKQYKNHVGETVSVVEYDLRLTGTISATMLADTDAAAVEASVKAWLEAQATGDTFGFAAGGTTIVSELRISEQNEEAASLSITCTYYPQVVATPGV